MFTQIILLFVVATVDSDNRVVGNYSKIDNKFCGESRLSYKTADDCSELHKNLGPEPLMHGRNATGGDAPWVVLLEINITTRDGRNGRTWCTGTIIDNYLVLAAARCVDRGPFVVYAGYNFSNYNTSQQLAYQVDSIAKPPVGTGKASNLVLVKMADELKPTRDKTTSYYIINKICLPAKDSVNTRDEYGMMAGWGWTGFEDQSIFGMPMQIGPRKIKAYDSALNKLVYSESIGPRACYGDSGAPLWQYYMGKAVVIGINTPGLNSECQAGNPVNASAAERVSMHIDWILSLIP